MINRLLVFFSILFLTFDCYAQNLSVKGVVVSGKDKSPMIGANVVLLNQADSAFIKGSAADVNGAFDINNVSDGRYILKIKYLGYDDFVKNLFLKEQSIDLGIINLNESTTILKEVDVTATVPPSKQKGDTTEYDSKAFKANPDANADDLVQKMPGITAQDGKVQAQGEDIKQVLVDGKPFFGDDPNAVLKNLPADVISKIQIFDKKSDQALFTGFDDGNSSKTMNIITKPEFNNGVFGKTYAGYGYGDDFNDDKYRIGGNINFFNGKRRISILAQSNDVNEQNFTTEDLTGVISSSSNSGRGGRGNYQSQRGGGSRGGSRGGGGYGGNDAGNFLVDTKNGISKTTSAGINYVDKWGEKLDVTASYFFNTSNNISATKLFRQYVLPTDSGLTYHEDNLSKSDNVNHRFNMKLEYKIDSMNSFLFQPKLSVQANDGSSKVIGMYNRLEDSVSSANNNFSSDLNALNFSSNLLYRHKFLKKGRTFSINLTPGYNQSNGTSSLVSESIYYSDTASNGALDQYSELDKKGYNVGSNVTYTEPLGEKSLLQFNYGTTYNKGNSDKETYNFSSVSGDYDKIDSSLSNKFNSIYFSQQVGTSYRMQSTKYELSVGAAFQKADLKNDQVYPYNNSLDKTFQSVLPNAMYQYRFSTKQNLRVFYRTYNNAPSVDQLQNVVNNSNPLQLTSGNPDLKQDYQHNFVARYSSSNPGKSTTFFALIGASVTNDYIGNDTYFSSADTTIYNIEVNQGSQLTRPVNLDGYFNLRSFITFSFPIQKIKSNLNLNLSANYSRTPGLINGDLNYATAPTYAMGAVLSSNINEKVDFLLSTTPTLNYVYNTIQTQLNSNYFNQNTRFKITWNFWKGLLIQSDVSHIYNRGLSESYDQNIYLWNAALGYKFLKDNKGDIRFSVTDLLNQNSSITRNTTDTYIEDSQTNVLQRYYMLTFTLNIKKYKGL